MRIDQGIDNGNVAAINPYDNVPHVNINNRSWHLSNNIQSNNQYQSHNLQYNLNSNYNHQETLDSHGVFENNTATSESTNIIDSDSHVKEVCNRQYRIYSQNNLNVNTSNNIQTANLAGSVVSTNIHREIFKEDSNEYSNTSPIEEDRAFEHSDTDEMSENGIQALPRGIVNPNYPGFQHLAHTLQDYSSTIENFYHSENEMTDDDVDIEITELAYENEPIQNNTLLENTNINNNNNNENTIVCSDFQTSENDLLANTLLDSHKTNDIPDIIKTISQNNNNINSINCDFNCTDTDIENNFDTKDIIGDFNKEIEDEIKQLLNYNINIQDDLEELRKDIKDTFAKPIENTINNISEVVNHVIKKLVETNSSEQVDDCTDNYGNESAYDKERDDVDKDNETNTRTEMNLSRPTFLLIENTNTNIVDAHLSDGKDEISIDEKEYDTDKLSNDVEKTIKQLSTELRKIIPKLDEMRERDKLWGITNMDTRSIVTDGNSNEVASSSCHLVNSRETNSEINITVHNRDDDYIKCRSPLKPKSESRASRERQKEIISPRESARTAQNKISVRNNSAKECDLGSFDVYNIETALPKLDLDAIENHIRAAKEAERRKRNDREEIRRRLAMGVDSEEYYSMGHTDRPGKKPSLHSRLQNGMNLQICFMNETASDNESQTSDVEKNSNYNSKSSSRSSLISKSSYNHPYQTRPLSVNITKQDKISTVQSGAKLRPTSLSMQKKSRSSHSLGHIELKESDFYALQATLQTEARIALAQAKEMARIQMERERRSRAVSPVTEMLRRSMEKASAPLAPDRRRVSRQLLTDMNIAQLQVIVNELHSQIESLNDSLVKLLMARDELHMGQDSMLVDIEDLTRYLGVKEQSKKTKGSTKSGMRRLTSLVHK
ncbi:schwannomin-interacting protein 1 homolog isoform X1 [Ostrinia nubilalis]|uniref:schwannomin-interacting protein 1 homolog isoform X1 n=1 Tax=Ostrinia nubilalis TaxID=29057 RepID=UPI0030826B80